MGKTALLGMILWALCGRAVAQPAEVDCRAALRSGYDYLYRFIPSEALDKFNTAITLAKETGNDLLYAHALFGAGQAVWYGGNFAGAADTVKRALQIFKSKQDTLFIGGALRILSNIYDDQGDYENAFKTVREALGLYTNFRDEQNKILSLVQMGTLYTAIGDYHSALDYYTEAWKEKPGKGGYPYRELNHRMGELYAARGMLDSAGYYYRNALTGNPTSKIIRLKMGETYLLKNNPDSAFAWFDSLYKEAKLTIDINILTGTSLGLSKIYLSRNDLPAALHLAQDALNMSTQRGARQNKRDTYQILSAIYERQGELAKALQYQKLYEKIKDSVISDQLKGQLYSFKQKAEESKQSAALKSLNDDKKLAQRTVLIICLLGISIVFVITLRHKNEKLHFKQRAAKLEMQALRAQMNPHFIFNCLSAINHFILNNETNRASEYLTRFSRLMRMVLVNAGKTTISLEEELNMLKLYLNMEQLRFKDAFDYYIHCDPAVQPSMVNVPSFILQPFCENAIWHGLLHKDGKGQLNIHFFMEGNFLICSIKDNGIGMEKAAGLKTGPVEKQHSFGHKLSAERLSLFNNDSNKGASFTIRDVTDEKGDVSGTLVTLRINDKQEYD